MGKGSALTFKPAVEAAGHDWPDDYVKGVGWVHEHPQELVESPVPFGRYALTFVRGLSGVAARTRHDYERGLRNHLLPAFGSLDLRDDAAIAPALVREWVNRLRAGERTSADSTPWQQRPLRPKTIQNLHGLVIAILQDAVETNPPLRSSNPAAGIRLPRLDEATGDDEMVVLTHDEFPDSPWLHQPDARDMLTVFAGTGLRLG